MANLGTIVATLGILIQNQLTDDQLTTLINLSEIEEVESRAWARLRLTVSLTTFPLYATGTVTITQNSPIVQGTGTAWTSKMVGMNFRVGIQGSSGSAVQLQPIEITALNPTTQTLTLQVPYPFSNGTGLGYQIFPRYYSISGMQRVTGVRQQIVLGRTTEEAVSIIDPYRNQSSSPSTNWYPFGQDSKANARIGLWPVETAANPYTVTGLKDHIDLQNATDVPLIPSAVLLNKAAMKACESLLSLRGDDKWANQRDYYRDQWRFELDKALDADRELYGVPGQVGDSQGDPNFGSYTPGLDSVWNRDVFGY